ncbi:MAG: DinB family protein [Planctomycetota bacterium]|jgi:uncharacterized damage-inducible protein DinB
MDDMSVINQLLEQSKLLTIGLISDMKDVPTTFPTSKGGNHPLWVLGHLVYAEASLVSGFIQGQENPLSKWDSLFGQGAEPVADLCRYPSMDELLAKYEKVRAETHRFVDSLTAADLDKPSHAPQDLKEIFGTVGQCLIMIGLHSTFHAGQVADARRSAGRKPLMG